MRYPDSARNCWLPTSVPPAHEHSQAIINAFHARISSLRHFNGAAALIKQRPKEHANELIKRLVIGVRSNLVCQKILLWCPIDDVFQVFRSIQFSLPIDTASGLWEDTDATIGNPATMLDFLSVDVANLLGTAKDQSPLFIDITQGDNERDIVLNELSRFFTRAKTVHDRLTNWLYVLPTNWFPHRLSAEDVPRSIVEAGMYGSYCDIFPDIIICSTFND